MESPVESTGVHSVGILQWQKSIWTPSGLHSTPLHSNYIWFGWTWLWRESSGVQWSPYGIWGGQTRPPALSLNGIQVDRNKYVSVQRNAAWVKGTGERFIPKPIAINVFLNRLPVCTLVDSGSLGDFMSSTLVDQLKLKRMNLEKPLGLQLAVQGSKSKINSVVNVNYSYQDIKDSRQFDIANLNDYDMILGTPWMYQHQVCIGLNPARIVIRSDVPLPILTGTDTKFLLAAASLSS